MTAEQIRDENQAINEAMALRKQNQCKRPRRLRIQTGYNETEFSKLFDIDRYHGQNK